MNRIIKILIYIFVILIVMAIAIYMYKLYDIRNNGAYYCSLIKAYKYNYGVNKYENTLYYNISNDLYSIEHAYNDKMKLSIDDKEVIDIHVDVKMFDDKSGLIISPPGALFGNKKFKERDGDYKIIINLDENHSSPYVGHIETVFNNIYTHQDDIIEPDIYTDPDDYLYVSFIELRDVMDYIYDKGYEFIGADNQDLNKLRESFKLTNDDVREYLKSDYSNTLKHENVQTIKIIGNLFDCSDASLLKYYPKFLI